MLFRKSKKYQMDMDTANAALQNIFAACDTAPNTIPFDKLALRQKAYTKPYNILLTITAILLLLIFLSPLIIVPISTYTERLLTPEPVTLVNNYVQDNILHLEFTGDNILYEQAYMETLDGDIIYVSSYDSQKGLLCFPYDAMQEVNIYIPIKDDTSLQFLLTPQP